MSIKDLIQIDEEIKNFIHKQNIREFSITKRILKQTLKGNPIGRKLKKTYKDNLKQYKKIQISINTYCKYKWIKMICQKDTDCFNGYIYISISI